MGHGPSFIRIERKGAECHHEIGHLLAAGLHPLEIAKLVACTHEVVRGIADLVVSVAVQVVGEEADRLHHGKKGYGKRQILAVTF